MALLKILQYPDERLHTVADQVPEVTNEVRALVRDMAETMYTAPGIGLAATQVDVHRRIIVIDISETHDQLLVLINPEIIARSGESDYEEGCLSVPGVYGKVPRSEQITVEALDENGVAFTLEAEGLLAVCIQHEMDHLLGKVFVEYWSRLKQTRIQAKFRKLRRNVDVIPIFWFPANSAYSERLTEKQLRHYTWYPIILPHEDHFCWHASFCRGCA